MNILPTLSKDGQAIIIGGSGAIGSEVTQMVTAAGFPFVHSFSRANGFDITREQEVKRIYNEVKTCGLPVRFLFIASGFLHDAATMPEKSIRQLNMENMEKAFRVNTFGPALVLKHFLPLVAKQGKAVIAALSAKVGSVTDNELGGWYSYRASKAALNQMIKTTSIELKRRNPDTVCVAIHPGTVDSKLSAPFQKTGLNVRPPSEAATEILAVINDLSGTETGSFHDYKNQQLPW